MQKENDRSTQSGGQRGCLPFFCIWSVCCPLLAVCAGLLAGILTVGKPMWSGEQEEWKAGQEITVISRESGSGTRTAFLELFGLWQEKGEERKSLLTQEAVIVNRSGSLLTAIASDPFSIGYGSMQDRLEGVRAVAVDGVTPTAEHIRDGSYPYIRPFFLAVRKEDPWGREFLTFALSEQGQRKVEEAGYLPVKADISVRYSMREGSAAGTGEKFTLAGSSAVMPLASVLAEEFLILQKQERHLPELELQESDSGSGLYLLLQGVADVALLSRELTKEEKEQVSWAAIASDGMVILVQEGNPVESLDREMIRRIFMGEERRWPE